MLRIQVPIVSAWFGRDILLAMKPFFHSLSFNGEHYFGSIRDNG